jgi:hypothetical protein
LQPIARYWQKIQRSRPPESGRSRTARGCEELSQHHTGQRRHHQLAHGVGIEGDASKIYDFCAAIVDATADLVIAFNLETAVDR